MYIKIDKIVLGLSILLLFGCGGGGGGGDEFIGAAVVTVSSSPREIDTGDRAEVRANIAKIHKNGIALKFRFPNGVRYVNGSALLVSEGDEVKASPTVDVSVENDSYLVFYLKQEQFPDDLVGALTFQLEGISKFSSGEIEVDADVDDPTIPNDQEFNAQEPEFGVEDSTPIAVTD